MSEPHHALMMRPKLVLSEARPRGPDRNRNISGVCSTCGDILLARLDDGDTEPDPERLRAKLDTVFAQHVGRKTLAGHHLKQYIVKQQGQKADHRLARFVFRSSLCGRVFAVFIEAARRFSADWSILTRLVCFAPSILSAMSNFHPEASLAY